MGLGAGETPDPQPGVQGLAPAFSRVGLVVFCSQGRLGVADGPFPFLLGPCKDRVVELGFFLFLFSLSASSASLFQLSFRMRFI